MREQTALGAPEAAGVAGRTRITARAVVIGLVCVVLNSVWLVDLEMMEARSYPTDLALLLNVLVFIVVLLAINCLLYLIAPRRAFSRTELLVIYVMLALGSSVAGDNVVQGIISTVGHVTWFATPENQWATTLLPHLPNWLTVKDKTVLEGFYLGQSSLYRPEHLRAWCGPMFWWIVLLMSLLWTSWCAAVLLQRRWIRQERLTFPIAQILLEMTRPDRFLFRRPLFWAGFTVSAVLTFLSTLHVLMPVVPAIPLGAGGTIELSARLPASSPWKAIYPTYCGLFPWVVGLSFLAPLDLLFSTWIFYLMRKLEMVGIVMAGWGQGDAWPFVNRQCAGAFMAIGLAAIWGGRKELAKSFRSVFDRRIAVAEGFSFGHRMAGPGMVLGLVISIVLGWASGMSGPVAVCFFAYFLMVGVASARIRAELGPPSNDLVWMGPDNLIPDLVGTDALSTQTLTALSLHHSYNRYYSWITMAHQADALKLFDTVQACPRRAWAALTMGSLLVASVATVWIVLHWVYQRGGMMLTFPISWLGEESFGPLLSRLEMSLPPDLRMVKALALGGGLTFGLLAMRARFVGFPLHPVGVAMGGVYLSDFFWLSVWFAWVVKLLLLRYGGGRVYQRATPFFLGLILGEVVVGALWIGLATIYSLPVGRIWR